MLAQCVRFAIEIGTKIMMNLWSKCIKLTTFIIIFHSIIQKYLTEIFGRNIR